MTVLLFPLEGCGPVEGGVDPSVLYQVTQVKMARRASALVAYTLPLMHSRFKVDQNDSATALSQHYPANLGGL